jgi:hypothetical protein
VLSGFADVSILGRTGVAESRVHSRSGADRTLQRYGASPTQRMFIVVNAQVVVVPAVSVVDGSQVPALATQGTYGQRPPLHLFIDEELPSDVRILGLVITAGGARLVGLGGADRARRCPVCTTGSTRSSPPAVWRAESLWPRLVLLCVGQDSRIER